MDKIVADYEGMANIAAVVGNLADEYSVCVEAIYETIDNLKNDWQGSDNLAYANKAYQYKDDMVNLGKSIDKYSEFLGQSAQIIRETQENIASEVGH